MNPVADSELQAFEHLVELHHATVHAVAFAITRNLALADDVAQQTFIAAWGARGSLRDLSKVRSWLCGIARNQSHKALRRTRRERFGDEVIFSTLVASGDTHDALFAREAEGHVRKALAAMPARYREPLVLFYWEEQSIAHVAAALAISEQAAQKRISRGRKYLREGLAHLETVGRRRGNASAAAAAVVAAIGMRSASAHAGSLAPRASYLGRGLRALVASGIGAVAMYALLVPREVPACPPPPPAAQSPTEDLEHQLGQLRRDVVRLQYEDNEAHDALREEVVQRAKPAHAASRIEAPHAASRVESPDAASRVEAPHAAARVELPHAAHETVAPAAPQRELLAKCGVLLCVGGCKAEGAESPCCQAVKSHTHRVPTAIHGISQVDFDDVVGGNNEACELWRVPGKAAPELTCHPPADPDQLGPVWP